jgi:hypothetical protein
MMYMGLDVVSTPLCKRRVPVREHKKPLHPRRLAYHNRVQKKWVKRHGMRDQYDIIVTPKHAFMHHDTIVQLQELAIYNGKHPMGVIIDDCDLT